MNLASVYRVPIPVAGSGVRFDATLWPQPPVNAVKSSDACTSPGADEGTLVVCGRPDRMRSGSGFMPAIFGEWQSWHPVMPTRYLPRSTWLSVDACANTDGATAIDSAHIDARQIVSFIARLQLNEQFCPRPSRPTGC